MAELASLGLRFRCFWSRPLGHAYELIEYVDDVSGRWAARSRCVRCGRESGLAVGEARHGAVFPNNPLATAFSRQGVKRSAPPAATPGSAPMRGVALVVTTPSGEKIALDRVEVRLLLGRERQLFWAQRVDYPGLPTLDPDLATAVARAAGEDPKGHWAAGVAHDLSDEIGTRSGPP